MVRRLSKDFTPLERGRIISAVKRGTSYSEVARRWSRKKNKIIWWTTIRAICNRSGIYSVKAKYDFQKNPKPKGFLQKIFDFLFS